MASEPAVMVAGEVGSDRIKPGGELGGGPEAGAMPINAHKGFLGQVVGVVFVAQHAAEELENRLGVAGHQVVEGGLVPTGQPLRVRAVPGGGVSGVHEGKTCRGTSCSQSARGNQG